MSLPIAVMTGVFKRGNTFGSILVSVELPFTKSQTKCSAIEDDPPLPQVNIFESSEMVFAISSEAF